MLCWYQPKILLYHDFLDIRKAFDSVSHQKVIKKLHLNDIRGLANNLLQSYLDDRMKFMSTNNNSSLEKTEYGVPQVSIFDTPLFLVYINDLLNSLQTIPSLFADDTVFS